MLETHPFKPFVPKNARYLILGSFTGKLADDNQYDWYYGTKRNQFWKILRGVYDLELRDIGEKQSLFNNLQIAMTDIIYQCERIKGSNLDNNLANIIYNIDPISKILSENNIIKILFSSRFVEMSFKKHFKDLINKYPTIELITLPSPSPRYAAKSLDEKIKIYKELLPILRI